MTCGRQEVDGQIIDRARRPRGNSNCLDAISLRAGLVREGRDFTIEDSDAKQLVAIERDCAQTLGNQSDRHQVRIFNPGKEQPWRTIVGVVPDTLMRGLLRSADRSGRFTLPLLGARLRPQSATVVVRPRAGACRHLDLS